MLSTPFVLSIRDVYPQSPAWKTFMAEKVSANVLAAFKFPKDTACSLILTELQVAYCPTPIPGQVPYQVQTLLPASQEVDVIRMYATHEYIEAKLIGLIVQDGPSPLRFPGSIPTGRTRTALALS